jgi:hypothetical protein
MANSGDPSMGFDRRIMRYARVAGALYVVLFVLAPFVFLFGKAAALVPDDPAATAANVAAMGTQFRLGMLIEATIFLVEIILAALLYVIFRPVHLAISLAAAFARLAEAIVQGVNLLTSILVLLVLGGAGYAAVFTTPQLEALAHLFLSANAFVVLVWGIFFGFHLLLFGYLVYESTFLPKWLGVLLVIAGAGYLLQSGGTILMPSASGTLGGLVVALAVPGELAFTLWLLARGIRVPVASTSDTAGQNT